MSTYFLRPPVAALALLIGAMPSAFAEVVQHRYTATLTHHSSLNDTVLIGGQPFAAGLKLSGTFSYDTSLPRQASPFQSIYEGYAPTNVATAELQGRDILAPRSTTFPPCQETACGRLTIERVSPDDGIGATESLTFRYAPFAAAPFPSVFLGSGDSPFRSSSLLTTMPSSPDWSSMPLFDFGGGSASDITSIHFWFSYDRIAEGFTLPKTMNLETMRFAGITLNLRDGSGVFARIETLQAIPEPTSGWLAVAGMAVLAAFARRARG